MATRESSQQQPGHQRTHPAYKELSKANGEVEAMSVQDIQQRLESLCLNTRGDEIILKKRLKVHARKKVLETHAQDSLPMELRGTSNPFRMEYLVIVDFEATCLDPNPSDYIHEIIEFPAILYSVKECKVVDQFHTFCKPMLNSELSPFCRDLTGISQAQVTKAPTFVEVFKWFEEWLTEKKLFSHHNFAIACDGIWDIARCLNPQCVLCGVQLPKYAKKWINLRKLFASFYRCKPTNIGGMLEHLGLSFQGRQHSGLDDALNLGRIVGHLLTDGCEIKYNQFLS